MQNIKSDCKYLFSIQGVLTLVFVLAGDIASLIDFASFLIWMFYGLAMVALLVMRKTKKDVTRTYKVLDIYRFKPAWSVVHVNI
jgi:amino acid transporter